jgi:predicted nucleic acid-binding protein
VSARHFLDTSVLLYSISRDRDETSRKERAIALLEADGGGLSVQVLQEFYVQATRVTRPDPLPHEIAAGLIRAWMRLAVQDLTSAVLTRALEIKVNHGFSYWDSAIIAAAGALGCRELYSEDLADGREVEGILIVDPFR